MKRVTRRELDRVLAGHTKWLEAPEEGERADLRWANLQDADLQRADLDFSSWPLWCCSVGVKVDKRIAVQLLYHAVAVMRGVDDAECKYVANLKSVIKL